MYFSIYGGIAAILVFIGLSLGGSKDNTEKVIPVLLAFGVFGFIGWTAMPVFAWNFDANWVLLLLVGVVMIVFSFLTRNDIPVAAFIPITISIIMLVPVQMVTTWSFFHADSYRRLLGEPVVSQFETDVSPVNISKIRRVDQELAHALGSKRIEEQPGLGSRVDLGTMNIQALNGCFSIKDGNNTEHNLCFENDLVWVGPLNHSGIGKWWNNSTTPGYVIVSATDPNIIHLVTAIKSGAKSDGEKSAGRMGAESTQASGFESIKLRYLLAGSYFGDDLVRQVRTSGFASTGLNDFSFEIDNAGKPYWVITRFERTIGFSGDDARGVVIVDAQTGVSKSHTIADAPAWVDRIQPEAMVTEQIDDWGMFVNGWMNSWLGKTDIVKATPGMSLVYGADGRSYWYTGIQSSGSDTGTNSFVLVDTRTKEVRRYMVSGANEVAAQGSAENAPGVREAGFKGTFPILYNISGEPTYFLTLKGGDTLVKMFAFVSVKNYESVGVGTSIQAALRDYQNVMIRGGQSLNLQDLTTQERIEAHVTNIVQIGDTFYLLLDGQTGVEFYGTSDVSPELKWTKPGQKVVVVVQRGESRSLQIYSFDIPSLDISSLPGKGS